MYRDSIVYGESIRDYIVNNNPNDIQVQKNCGGTCWPDLIPCNGWKNEEYRNKFFANRDIIIAGLVKIEAEKALQKRH